LFGGGFLERATKRIEEQKAIAKVAGAGNGPLSKRKQNQDPRDFHRSLEKGAPAKYGGGKFKRQQPYPPKYQRRDQKKSWFPNKQQRNN